jgi:5-(carboxyamino)imidazole ribonucleotide synthase
VSELVVVGDGQLARMMAPPAVALGINLRLLAGSEASSAAQVIVDRELGDYKSIGDLSRVVGDTAVVTFDHEHVPNEHLVALQAEGHACRPGPHALLFAQDKLKMRHKLDDLAVPSPRWAEVDSLDDVLSFGLPLVLKTARGGYDGKGVWVIDSADDAAHVYERAASTGVRLLVEELVDFRRELSAQVARSASGEMCAYPVVQSRQLGGVCVEVIAPAPDIDPVLAEQAQLIAEQIAREVDVVGMLAVELFETSDGRVLVNELAMRPHNTGHWSIEGAATSQFENHLRAVLDLPLGPTGVRQRWAVMVNVLGGHVTDLVAARREALQLFPAAHIHLYGKEVKPGRKVGHVTCAGSDLAHVLACARGAAEVLTGQELATTREQDAS